MTKGTQPEHRADRKRRAQGLSAGQAQRPFDEDAPTGNGRRESYAHLPMPRMTNTYMLAGQSDPEEILRSVKNGLYAVNFGGGQVDITSGKFVFSASEAYLIEDGKVTAPVKGATLIGNGPEVMTRVSMVGNGSGARRTAWAVCGKEGQSGAGGCRATDAEDRRADGWRHQRVIGAQPFKTCQDRFLELRRSKIRLS